MMSKDKGNTTTFCSFKHGAGRTMAVANVALVAAMNGKRVLVMDWDIDAPGLFTCFRDLLDRAMDFSPADGPLGLDFLYEWSDVFSSAGHQEEFVSLQAQSTQAGRFDACLADLIEPSPATRFLRPGAALDFIGAGAVAVRGGPASLYEHALAEFSWTDFFARSPGGRGFDHLRAWARSRYDVVLLDIHTGVDDEEGVCAMLLPDTVVLSLALYQDDDAAVAKENDAIRDAGKDHRLIAALPMKVTRRHGANASEAQATVLKELNGTGRFASSPALDDSQLAHLALEAALPFYEAAAPYLSPERGCDPLTLAYLRRANKSVDEKIFCPSYERETTRFLKRLLIPTNASTGYVSALSLADPAFALSEMGRLIESACAVETVKGDLDAEYMAALFEAALNLMHRFDVSDDNTELYGKLIGLITRLYQGEPEKFAEVLIYAVERTFEMIFVFYKHDDEFLILKALDSAFSHAPRAPYLFKRLWFKRYHVRRLIEEKDMDGIPAILHSAAQLANTIDPATLSQAERRGAIEAAVDVKLLSGTVCECEEQFDNAVAHYKEGLDIAGQAGFSDFHNVEILTELTARLASLLKGEEAVRYAIDAVQIDSRFLEGWLGELADIVIDQATNPEQITSFCTATIAPHAVVRRRRHIDKFFNIPSKALSCIVVISDFARRLTAMHDEQIKLILADMVNVVSQAVHAMLVKRNMLAQEGKFRGANVCPLKAETVESMLESLEVLEAIIKDSNYSGDFVQGLEETIALLRSLHP